MAGNTFGEAFKVTTFGESHGEGLGCIIDGCPSGIPVDLQYLQEQMDRRKPGAKNNASVTARQEGDKAEVLSGIFEGKTTGTSIAILIRNTNQHSGDYSNIMDKFRPGHADFTFFEKYGIRDYRGGGRSSGRETCARVAAGAFANMFLKHYGVSIAAFTLAAAGVYCNKIDLGAIEQNSLRAADNEAAEEMNKKIEQLRKEGNSAGGIIECRVKGIPAGLGEPVFDKADALIAHAMLSIGAVKGIEFGAGFNAAELTGKQNNDQMRQGPTFLSNNAGGILGGITRGDEIIFRVAIKPVPSIFSEQKTINTNNEDTDLQIVGRHDVCLCPRIVPVIEAMTAITLADLMLRNRSAKL